MHLWMEPSSLRGPEFHTYKAPLQSCGSYRLLNMRNRDNGAYGLQHRVLVPRT